MLSPASTLIVCGICFLLGVIVAFSFKCPVCGFPNKKYYDEGDEIDEEDWR